MRTTASSAPDMLFDGACLRAQVFRPALQNGCLLVTFRQRIQDSGAFAAPLPSRRFVAAGWSHLHIQSRWNDWYVNRDTQALCAALTPLAARFDHHAGIGFSMGGYASLRLSAALSLDVAVVVSPQVSVAPGVVPFDARFRDAAAGFDPSLGDLRTYARDNLTVVVIFDPFRPLDLRNARMIGDILPGLQLCRYSFGGHPATGVLRATVTFGAIQSLVLGRCVTRAAVLALHRENRASTAKW